MRSFRAKARPTGIFSRNTASSRPSSSTERKGNTTMSASSRRPASRAFSKIWGSIQSSLSTSSSQSPLGLLDARVPGAAQAPGFFLVG